MKNVPTLPGPSAITADAPGEVEDVEPAVTAPGVEQPPVVESPGAPVATKMVSGKNARAGGDGSAAASFVSENAIALTLAGLGAAWLALSMGGRRDLVSEYPITASALAIATGAGIALALPQTQLENRFVRPVARGIADEARSLVGHVRADLHAARDAVGSLARSAQGEG
jgi:hypothetical protein